MPRVWGMVSHTCKWLFIKELVLIRGPKDHLRCCPFQTLPHQSSCFVPKWAYFKKKVWNICRNPSISTNHTGRRWCLGFCLTLVHRHRLLFDHRDHPVWSCMSQSLHVTCRLKQRSVFPPPWHGRHRMRWRGGRPAAGSCRDLPMNMTNMPVFMFFLP